MIDAGAVLQGAMADRVVDDLSHLTIAIAKATERGGNRPIDDLEVTATREFLEFNESEIRLDAGSVAIHHQADRAGRRDNAGLGISVAMLAAEVVGTIPCGYSCLREFCLRTGFMIERDWGDG